MSVYTRPNPSKIPAFSAASLKDQPSPGLIFQKWQAWDDFQKFDTKESRREYLPNIAKAVQAVYGSSVYHGWYNRYTAALKALEIEGALEYPTVWRLLVGYGTNPTLESGIMLHHLYGFPYIPGSEVKGLLHHVAEMQLMEKEYDISGKKIIIDPADALFHKKTPLPEIPSEILTLILADCKRIWALFGSIHIEQVTATIKDEAGRKKEIAIGPTAPKNLLDVVWKKLKDDPAKRETEPWKSIMEDLKMLLEKHTGGILRFYDAVPAEGQDNLLQLDVLTPHYPNYYKEEGKVSPSDDQSPNPVVFLAVRPGVKFYFYYRSELERIKAIYLRDEKDKEAKALIDALGGWDSQNVRDQVELWLKIALGEWGIGAKTAAGYGYFNTGLEFYTDAGNQDEQASSPPAASQPQSVEPEEPQPFASKIKAGSKLWGISKNYNQGIWKRIAENEYIAKITGQKANLVPLNINLPAREISANGNTVTVFYQQEQFYCTVEVKLQGIASEGEAQWVWEKVILPVLRKL